MIHEIEPYEDRIRRGGSQSLRMANEFFGVDHPVFKAFYSITSLLNERRISYAVTGDMAMIAYGCPGTVRCVEIVVSSEALEQIHHRFDFEQTNGIEFHLAGSFHQNDRSKLIVFPEPLNATTEIDGIRYLRPEHLIELKIALGLRGAGQLRAMADVVGLIKVRNLQADFALKLNPALRGKFAALWEAVATDNVIELTRH